jgi:hypothetical protein
MAGIAPVHTAAWWPTPKWWAATVLAASGLLATWGGTGWHWSNTLSGATITLVGQRLVAYLVPNQTPTDTSAQMGHA